MVISYKVGNAGFNCISIWWQWLLPGTSENLMTNRCSVAEPADLCTQVTENITISYRRDCNLSVAEELQNQTRHYREINVVYLTACSSPFFVISGSVTWGGVISGLWHHWSSLLYVSLELQSDSHTGRKMYNTPEMEESCQNCHIIPEIMWIR